MTTAIAINGNSKLYVPRNFLKNGKIRPVIQQIFDSNGIIITSAAEFGNVTIITTHGIVSIPVDKLLPDVLVIAHSDVEPNSYNKLLEKYPPSHVEDNIHFFDTKENYQQWNQYLNKQRANKKEEDKIIQDRWDVAYENSNNPHDSNGWFETADTTTWR